VRWLFDGGALALLAAILYLLIDIRRDQRAMIQHVGELTQTLSGLSRQLQELLPPPDPSRPRLME
jgi:hypothetical protein